MKNIIKKSFADIAVSFSIILLGFLFASLVPHFMSYTPAQRLFFHDLLARVIWGLSIISTLGIISHHFIMMSEILTAKRVVRRGISVFTVALIAIFVNLSVFSIIPLPHVFVGIVLIVLLGVAGMIVGFIIEDKSRKKDIAVINKRLNELKEEQ